MTIAEALVANYLGDGGIISSEQIGIEANIEWGKLIAQLFKICRGLRNMTNMQNAIEKWNNDRSFVCTLKATNTQKVQIKRLIY